MASTAPVPARPDVFTETWGVIEIAPTSEVAQPEEAEKPPVREAVRDYVREPFSRTIMVFFGIQILGLPIGYLMLHSSPFGAPGGTPFRITVGTIFLHNLVVVMLPILVFPLLFWAPAVSGFMTGASIGWLMRVWFAVHLSGGALFGALLPHGIVEIPAMLVGSTIAWRLGRSTWNRARFGGRWSERAGHALVAAAPVLGLVVLALALAAFLEINVTPVVVESLLG